MMAFYLPILAGYMAVAAFCGFGCWYSVGYGLWLSAFFNALIGVFAVKEIGEISWRFILVRRGRTRRVAVAIIGRCEVVSTIFLGMDHNWRKDGPPLLFETMVFGGAHDLMMRRCSTWDEALKQHDEVCAMVQRANGEP